MAKTNATPSPFMQFGERGMKAIDFSAWGGFQGFLDATSNSAAAGHKGVQLKRVVPWLARATSTTANAVSSLPFEITRDGGEVVDSSTDWQNKTGGIPNPKRLLKLVAAAITSGAAYLLPQRTEKLIVDVQYLAPHTITPEYEPGSGVLKDFLRNTDMGFNDKLQPDELIYFWLPDSDVELGPALSHPLGTATASADLLYSMDTTLGIYGKRGFVPATILGAKGMPIEAERIKMEAWWDRFLRGWSGVVAKIFNAETLSIERVGAGLEELKGVYIEVTRQQIENIGAAFGIPAGLFLSDKAYATEMDVLTRQWYETSEFKAIYQTIEETMTDQLFAPYGLRWQFKPETLDIFQVDENERAQAFSLYTGAGIPRSIAAEMLGLELPEGVDFAKLDEPSEQEKQAQELALAQAKQPQGQPVNGQKPKPPAKSIYLTAEEIKDLNLWRQIAERQFMKGHAPALDFVCKALPEVLAEGVRERLTAAKTLAEVLMAFQINPVTETPAPDYRTDAILKLADSMNKSTEFTMSRTPFDTVRGLGAGTVLIKGGKVKRESLVKDFITEAFAPQESRDG